MTDGIYIKRSDLWTLQYHSRRYLEFVSEEKLVQRCKDILANFVTLRDDLKLSPHPINNGGEYWSIMWNDLCDECELRGYKFPGPFAYKIKDAQAPKLDVKGLSEAIKVFQRMKLDGTVYLVKYGNYEFLKNFLDKGLLRIMPASYYQDSSLNTAIRDSELLAEFIQLPSESRIETIDEKTGKTTQTIPIIGNVEFQLTLKTNYYVSCFSQFSPRLFGDFEADCCVVIKNPLKFLQRLREQFNFQSPHFHEMGREVEYFDPYNIEKKIEHIYFMKHFRYSYQREYRTVWLPPKPTEKLNPVFLELGNLEEYCEIIKLQ